MKKLFSVLLLVLLFSIVAISHAFSEVNTTIYEEQGMMSKIKIEIGVDGDGYITSFNVVEHNETKGIGSRVLEDATMINGLIGKHIKDAQIDAITGSTVTSNAVNRILAQAAKNSPSPTKKIEVASSANVQKAQSPNTVAKVTMGQSNALRAAQSYLRSMPFSYDGLIKQLKYEGYSSDEAEYAADHCEADWYAQALKDAQQYLHSMAFSYDGLIKQLKYEGYSAEEAKYAADNCKADWNAQAVASAKGYLDSMAFSRTELIKQLEYEGFTHEQAVYGVEQNGYSSKSIDEATEQASIERGKNERTSSFDDESNSFIQLFANSYRNGDPLTYMDFLHFHEGTAENFLDTDFGYQYIAYDYTGKVVPNDSTGGFATMRGIQLFDSMDKVQKRYGYRSVKLYEYQNDVLYQAVKDNKDANYKQLENCTHYIVYTYDKIAQIVFFFNPKSELVFTTYLYGTVYKDAGALKNLKKGSEGRAVRDLQTRLAELGFYTSSINGEYGSSTVKAVKAFEKANDLEETGVATVELQRLIYTIKMESEKTEDVIELNGVETGKKIEEVMSVLVELPSVTKIQCSEPIVMDGITAYQVKYGNSEFTITCNPNNDGKFTVGALPTSLDSKTGSSELFEFNGYLAQAVSGSNDSYAMMSRVVEVVKAGSCTYDGITYSLVDGMFVVSCSNGSAPSVTYDTLSEGSTGDEVLKMKHRMQELGYFTAGASLSATYNGTCVERVKQFQQKNGLDVTGIADHETLSLLYSDKAKEK